MTVVRNEMNILETWNIIAFIHRELSPHYTEVIAPRIFDSLLFDEQCSSSIHNYVSVYVPV